MDRQIVYPGAIPLDTDILNIQRNAMVALGYVAQAAFGSGTIVDGLVLAPTGPATMVVNVGPGSIVALSTIDATSFGSLAADSTDPLVKIGINSVGSTPFTLTAPSTSGQSINYLIEAAFAEADTNAVVLPYYNAANPAQPYTGPANSGSSQNTQRTQRVSLQLKAGTAAPTGTQTTPAVDGGWIGLYAITVNYGQTSITSTNLTTGNPYGSATIPTAPFIPAKLGPGTRPGFSTTVSFTTPGTTSWTAPAGVTKVRYKITGGGGGGAGSSNTQASGGGGAGGTAIGEAVVVPGTVYTVVVASGGGGGATSSAGVGGGTSSFASFASAPGGGGAAFAGTTSAGGTPATGTGGAINVYGGYGDDGAVSSTAKAGMGGASFWGGGGRTALSSTGLAGLAYGSGGGGSYGPVAAAGGAGAPGIVALEY